MKKIIAASILLLVSLNFCLAKEFFVSEEGDDTNPGNIDHPWASIEKSIQKLEAGDVLFIRGGIYRQTFDISVSGNQDKWITIRNYQDEVVNIWYSVDLSNPGNWVLLGNNIWATGDGIFTTSQNYDLATIWHDDLSHWSLKKYSPEDLQKQWDFYQNHEEGRIEVYSLDNPASLAAHIEAPRSRPIGPYQFITNIAGSYILMEGINYKYINVHGINVGGGSHHIIFRNGAISHGGGANISPTYSPPVRWGDCVDVTDDTHHIWFENSVFGEYPDGTLTNQGTAGRQEQLYFRNNYIFNSTCGIHCWFGVSGKANEGLVLGNIYYEGNTFNKIGKGWFEDQAVMIGGIQFLPKDNVLTKQIYIRDNLFLDCGATNYTGNTWRGVNCPINIAGGDVDISDNIIFNTPMYGIFVQKVHQEFVGKIYNNLLIACGMEGIKIFSNNSIFSQSDNHILNEEGQFIADTTRSASLFSNFFSRNDKELSLEVQHQLTDSDTSFKFLLNGYTIDQSPTLKIMYPDGSPILDLDIVTPPGSVNIWACTDRFGRKLKKGNYVVELQSAESKVKKEIELF